MNTQEKKEKYEKPVLRTIELVAEEVLGMGCNKGSLRETIQVMSAAA